MFAQLILHTLPIQVAILGPGQRTAWVDVARCDMDWVWLQYNAVRWPDSSLSSRHSRPKLAGNRCTTPQLEPGWLQHSLLSTPAPVLTCLLSIPSHNRWHLHAVPTCLWFVTQYCLEPAGPLWSGVAAPLWWMTDTLSNWSSLIWGSINVGCLAYQQICKWRNILQYKQSNSLLSQAAATLKQNTSIKSKQRSIIFPILSKSWINKSHSHSTGACFFSLLHSTLYR